MRIELPEKVTYIIDTLQSDGYEAYAVGGCVRDSILGRSPEDWDITTSALPHQVKSLFRRTIDTGIQHGTVTVLLDKEGFEVTTYRIDGEYEDSRHPKEVMFTPNLVEDLRRRDFTINAMAYNEQAGLVDVFDGMLDMQKKEIKCVGEAKERFEEDALRILRAVRFSAQLGYEIEERTQQAIRELADSLKNISAERIRTELVKLLISPNPTYLYKAFELGITAVVLPEFEAMMRTQQCNPHHCFSVGEHTLRALQETEQEKVLRLAVLFHDVGKPSCKTTDDDGIDHFYRHGEVGKEITAQIMNRLRFDNDTKHKVCRLVQYHDMAITNSAKAVRRSIHKVGEDLFASLLLVKNADIAAQSNFQQAEKRIHLEEVKQLYQEICENKQCLSLKDLEVNGKDLLDLGIQRGKEIGDTLGYLLDQVLEYPEWNERTKLIDMVKEMQK